MCTHQARESFPARTHVRTPPPASSPPPAVFKLYDFNESGQLTMDELVLALQSTATGLCKIAG